jgi:hypothetical protein
MVLMWGVCGGCLVTARQNRRASLGSQAAQPSRFLPAECLFLFLFCPSTRQKCMPQRA